MAMRIGTRARAKAAVKRPYLWARRARSTFVGGAARLLFGPNFKAIVVEGVSGEYVIDVRDQKVSRSLSRRGYGAEELERLSHIVDDTSRVLVVGAHVGAIVFPLAGIVAHVDAVEANPYTFRLLEMTQQIRQASNVTLHQFAASEEAGEITFLFNTENSGGSKRMPMTSDYAYVYDSPEIGKVRSARLDDVFSGARFDMIFMDIEGSEYFALAGMPDLLSKVQTLVIEFIPHHLRNVASIDVADLLRVLKPGNFTRMIIPSKNVTVLGDEFEAELQAMMAADEQDEGLIFTRN